MKKYLTPADKDALLAQWAATLADFDGAERPGMGYPDPDIIPWVARLNAIDGVAVEQSCSGHLVEQPEGPSILWDGQLYLWLSQRMAQRWYMSAYHLPARLMKLDDEHRGPLHARTSILWFDDGTEIADITFPGKNAGALDRSLSIIVDFLESVRA